MSQDRVEDKLSEAVLRNEFKVFDRVFESKVQMAEITPDIIDDIKMKTSILDFSKSEDSLTIISSEDLKSEIEKLIEEKKGVAPSVKTQGYVSSVTADVEDNEIVLTSEDRIVLHPMAGSLAGR